MYKDKKESEESENEEVAKINKVDNSKLKVAARFKMAGQDISRKDHITI